MLTIYSRFGCSACDATKRYCARHGIDFLEVNVALDAGARAFVERLGYVSVPVCVAGTEHWSGFRPDRLRGLTRDICD
jgi:glutaredoxin-like protein NrdH